MLLGLARAGVLKRLKMSERNSNFCSRKCLEALEDRHVYALVSRSRDAFDARLDNRSHSLYR